MKPQTLKNFIFILIALLILTGQSFAGKNMKDTASSIREVIKEQVKHPGFSTLMDNACCADIIFTVTKEGKLLVNRILSNNEALSNYLKEKLSKIRLNDYQSPVNHNYRIKLSFKLV
jgi:hypothetical protein